MPKPEFRRPVEVHPTRSIRQRNPHPVLQKCPCRGQQVHFVRGPFRTVSVPRPVLNEQNAVPLATVSGTRKGVLCGQHAHGPQTLVVAAPASACRRADASAVRCRERVRAQPSLSPQTHAGRIGSPQPQAVGPEGNLGPEARGKPQPQGESSPQVDASVCVRCAPLPKPPQPANATTGSILCEHQQAQQVLKALDLEVKTKFKMAHKTLVAVVVSCDGHVLLGKHAEGPFKGKWGVPSIDSSVDRRPSRVALRLAETCCLGMLGTRNTLTATRMQPSALGLQLYEVKTDVAMLPVLLERVCAFVGSCFAAGSQVPTGLVPWQACKWSSVPSDVQLDPISQDAVTAWRSQQPTV